MTDKLWKIVAGAALLVGVVALYMAWPSLPSFGAVGVKLVENYDPYVRYNGGTNTALPFKTTSTMQIGTSGTAVTNTVVSTCSMIANGSINATSTGYAYCTGVTGVTSSDTTLLAQFATTTASIAQNRDDFWIVSAKASSTAGAVDFILYNGTGANAVPSAVGRMGSTTAVYAAH